MRSFNPILDRHDTRKNKVLRKNTWSEKEISILDHNLSKDFKEVHKILTSLGFQRSLDSVATNLSKRRRMSKTSRND